MIEPYQFEWASSHYTGSLDGWNYLVLHELPTSQRRSHTRHVPTAIYGQLY